MSLNDAIRLRITSLDSGGDGPTLGHVEFSVYAQGRWVFLSESV